MTDEKDPNAEWPKGVQTGDAQALVQLFERYAQRLARLAEQHLSRKLAGRLDAEDVVQSAFGTFFRRCAQGKFQIDSSAQIWKLLVEITVQKARAKGRFHTAGMRHVGAEVPGGDDARLREAIAHEPGPEEAVALVDQIEALLRGLPPLCGPVLEMRLQGYRVSEIAPKLDVTRRTVQRALNRLQERLDEPASDGPA